MAGFRLPACGHYLGVIGLVLAIPAAAAAQTARDSAISLNEQATAAFRVGSPEGMELSIRLWAQVAPLLRRAGAPAAEGITLNTIGLVQRALGRRDSALVYFRRALAIARVEGDRPGEGQALHSIGRLYHRLRFDSALASYRHELAIWREEGDRTRQAMALSDIGAVLSDLGRPDSALASYREALTIQRDLNDRAGEGTTLNNIGVVLNGLGRPDSALGLHRQALVILRDQRDRAGEGTALHNIALVHSALGRADSALVYYRQALVIRRGQPDRAAEGATLHNIGAVHDGLGRPDSALASYQRALSLRRDSGDRAGEGTTLNGIGHVLGGLGRMDSALTFYRQALAIAREVGHRELEGATLNNIGHALSRLGRPDSALASYREARAVARATGNRGGEGAALHNIGEMYSDRGRPDSALVSYRRAIAIWREVGDRAGEGATLHNIGAWLSALGRPDSALASYRQALAIAREVSYRELERVTLHDIGTRLHRAVPPDLRGAVAHYDSATATQATIGAHAGSDPNRVSLGERAVNLFAGWTLAWLARHEEVGARRAALSGLAASERGRAQALLDLMRGATRGAGPGADLAVEGAALLRAATGSGAVVLVYLVTRDTLLLWFGAHGDSVMLMRRVVTEDSLTELVSQYRRALTVDNAARGRFALRDGAPLEVMGAATRGVRSPTTVRPADSVARALARLLLPPELDRLPGGTREVLIVPHGVLGLVPFGALPLDSAGTPLAVRHALRHAPSLTAVREAEARPSLGAGTVRTAALRHALVVGNPVMPTTASFGETFEFHPLPQAEVEARWLAARLGPVALTAERASEAEVRRRFSGAPVVHLATHGFAYASEARSRLSFVALAPGEGQDGFLTVGELLDDPTLTLSTDLVVLSACQTGLGDLKQAEGTVGLQRALLARGARSVLVSLWSVSDAATSLLMQRFYTHWLDDTDRPFKAEALRRAQDDVRARPGFENPRYWAGFQLVGAQ